MPLSPPTYKRLLRNALLLLTGVLLGACKLDKLYNQTLVSEDSFSTTIKFKRLSSGHIVIPVIIDGSEYSFLLDTGTPNIVSKELAERLKLKHIFHKNYVDSQHNKLELSLAEISEIQIGGISFQHTATTIHDFQKSPPTIRCLNISGVIGANLMNKAIWKFDFQQNTITISSEKGYEKSENLSIIPFQTGYSGTPKINIGINGLNDGKAFVDFGARGFYKSSKKTFAKLCKMPYRDKCRTTSGYGSLASGAFGYEQPDSSYLALVHSFSAGSGKVVTLPHQLISLTNNPDKLLGLDFFENFETTINWKDKELALMQPTKSKEIDRYDSFGFRVIYKEDHLYIGFLYNNSPATKAGLQLGDHITQIDGIDFEQPSEDQFCELLSSNLLSKDNVKLTIERDGESSDIQLQKADLFTP